MSSYRFIEIEAQLGAAMVAHACSDHVEVPEFPFPAENEAWNGYATRLGEITCIPGPLSPLRRRYWEKTLSLAHIGEALAPISGLDADLGFAAGLVREMDAISMTFVLEYLIDAGIEVDPFPLSDWRRLIEQHRHALVRVVHERLKLPPAIAPMVGLESLGVDSDSALTTLVQTAIETVDFAASEGHLTTEDLQWIPGLEGTDQQQAVLSAWQSVEDTKAAYRPHFSVPGDGWCITDGATLGLGQPSDAAQQIPAASAQNEASVVASPPTEASVTRPPLRSARKQAPAATDLSRQPWWRRRPPGLRTQVMLGGLGAMAVVRIIMLFFAGEEEATAGPGVQTTRRRDGIEVVAAAPAADTSSIAEGIPAVVSIDLSLNHLGLTATALAMDPDGDKVKLVYRWTRNGKTLSHLGPTIPRQAVKKGSYKVAVRATDGDHTSAPLVAGPWVVR